MPLKLTCFPLNPDDFLRLLQSDLHRYFSHDVRCLLELGIQEYPDDMEEAASPEPGKYFDLVSLLGGGVLIRNNGDRVALHGESFKGKHVLVCCFHVPFTLPCGWRSSPFHSLLNLCKELCSTRRDEFEMVMVARMNALADEEEAFNHFFSGFPESCLAVPFQDSKRRDYICKVLGHQIRYDYGGQFGRLFLNGEGKVCPSLPWEVFDYYGAEAFPFTEEAVKKADEQCRKVIFEKANSLEAVLRCNDSSPDFVYKFGGGPRLPISQLMSSNTHVGILLYTRHDLLIPIVREMYERCRKDGKEFEIVVVYSPFGLCPKMEPETFKHRMDALLHEHIDTCRSWWCLPFDNSVSRRFWRITQKYGLWGLPGNSRDCSKLMVVGPGVGRLDMCGGMVMEDNGMDAYPFTIEAAIAHKMKELAGFTLESLLPANLKRGDASVPAGELESANKVFLWINTAPHSDLRKLVSIYHKMKERFGYELVVVELGADSNLSCPLRKCGTQSQQVIEHPWYVWPADAVNASLMRFRRALKFDGFGSVVGFGDDGRVCSVKRISGEISLRNFTSDSNLHDSVEERLGYEMCNDDKKYDVAATFYKHKIDEYTTHQGYDEEGYDDFAQQQEESDDDEEESDDDEEESDDDE